MALDLAETRMQVSTGPGVVVNATLHHTLALGEVASPCVTCDMS